MRALNISCSGFVDFAGFGTASAQERSIQKKVMEAPVDAKK